MAPTEDGLELGGHLLDGRILAWEIFRALSVPLTQASERKASALYVAATVLPLGRQVIGHLQRDPSTEDAVLVTVNGLFGGAFRRAYILIPYLGGKEVNNSS